MTPFYTRFPELAARETRTVILLQPDHALPVGEYRFVEWYCDEEACDCRRVLLQVHAASNPGRVLATISYGWEPWTSTRVGCTATRRPDAKSSRRASTR